MPSLELDEADLCPHCGAILRNPPKCCDKARQDADWWEYVMAIYDEEDLCDA